jgi:glutathione peroxidase
MGIRDIELTTIDGGSATLADYADKTVLVVNVASRCGNTPQYEQLEELQKEYGDRGFTVLGFPCNQFMGQEPGTAEEIKEFCSTTYGVTFPLMDKINVNGRSRHPLYAELTQVEDERGNAGNIKWNFEKFVIAPDGSVTRFRPSTLPDDPIVIAAIEDAIGSADEVVGSQAGAA